MRSLVVPRVGRRAPVIGMTGPLWPTWDPDLSLLPPDDKPGDDTPTLSRFAPLLANVFGRGRCAR